MKQVKCTRGFGLLSDPQTGETYNVEGENTVEVPEDVAERLKEAHSGIVISDVSYECGYNGCGRTVDNPEDHCWQHPNEA